MPRALDIPAHDRRRFLRGLTATAVATTVASPLLRATPASAAGLGLLPSGQAAGADLPGDVPATPFEANGGSRWTTHSEELDFLDSIGGTASPNRFDVEMIGTSAEGRPLQLFSFGTDDTGDIATPGTRPTVYIVCTQHGNEPAGREAGIALIRDLAYADDEATIALLARANIIITPTANPDGRHRNSRGNSRGTDINRDHLALTTEEAQAMAAAGNAWKPFMIVDHHEYGPGQPLLYDDDVLYLWPRNLNVDRQVREEAKRYCIEYMKVDCEAAGYTADEYGIAKLGPNYGPVQTPVGMPTGVQTAGNWDDGISRNAAGLRHAMGILVESAVSARLHDPTEATGNLIRRVDSQRVVMASTLRYLEEEGQAAMAITTGAPIRKVEEGEAQAPVYFDGQDDPHPSSDPATLAPQTVDDPGALRYRFPSAALNDDLGPAGATLSGTLGLHEIDVTIDGDEAVVEMAQHAKPLIPLLLDSRGQRSVLDATPQY